MMRKISEDEIKRLGFRITGGRQWQDGQTHYSLRLPQAASEYGISIELCRNHIMNDGTWFVWIVMDEPYRFIPMRKFRYMHELIELYKGLAGLELVDNDQLVCGYCGHVRKSGKVCTGCVY